MSGRAPYLREFARLVADACEKGSAMLPGDDRSTAVSIRCRRQSATDLLAVEDDAHLTDTELGLDTGCFCGGGGGDVAELLRALGVERERHGVGQRTLRNPSGCAGHGGALDHGRTEQITLPRLVAREEGLAGHVELLLLLHTRLRALVCRRLLGPLLRRVCRPRERIRDVQHDLVPFCRAPEPNTARCQLDAASSRRSSQASSLAIPARTACRWQSSSQRLAACRPAEAGSWGLTPFFRQTAGNHAPSWMRVRSASCRHGDFSIRRRRWGVGQGQPSSTRHPSALVRRGERTWVA